MEGHEFLTSIGILHRDISENNIVLGVYPWEERGYLIDFDMAILQDAEEPTVSNPSTDSDDEFSEVFESSSPKPVTRDEKQRMKGLRTVSIFVNVVPSSIHVISRAHFLTFLSMCSWARDTHISMTWSHSFMCYSCSFSPMQDPFPNRSWRMLTKEDLFNLLGLGACPIPGVGLKSLLIGQMAIHKL